MIMKQLLFFQVKTTTTEPSINLLQFQKVFFYRTKQIYWAAFTGHIEIIKILAPLTDNPNTPDKHGKTPIYWAAQNGHIEIVNILATLTDNPNRQRNNE